MGKAEKRAKKIADKLEPTSVQKRMFTKWLLNSLYNDEKFRLEVAMIINSIHDEVLRDGKTVQGNQASESDIQPSE